MPDLTDREAEVWRKLWSTPQATAWAVEEWRWRGVALYTRWSVRAEAENASAAIMAQVVRLSDQIGMSPAGLVENGWKIAEPAEESPPATLRNGQPTALERARQRSRSRFPTTYEPHQDPQEQDDSPDPRSVLTQEYRAASMRDRLAALSDGDGPV